MVIVSGELGTNEFRTTLLHELVHGFSDVVLDAMGAVPWAMEGYAELVAARVSAVRGDPGPWILRRSIATILALRDNAQIASVARLMRVSQREFAEFLKTYPWFTAHSGLLLCMFTSWCSRKPGVLEACRNGIRAECSDPSALASALEQAAGLDSDGMDAAFLNYCAELESRMQRPGPTLSADAMQLHC